MMKMGNHARSAERVRGFSLLELLMVSTVLIVVLSAVAGVVHSVNQNHARQRSRLEAINNASAALDAIVRMIRMAGNNPNNIANFPSTSLPAIVPASNSIRLRSDWNPADGDLSDPYEDIEFTVNNGVMQKQERLLPTPETTPVPFFENIESLSFTYLDVNNTVTTNGNAVAVVNIVLTTRSMFGSPMTLSSSVSVRRLEK